MSKPVFQFSRVSVGDGFGAKLVEFEIPGGATTPEECVEAVAEIAPELVGRFIVLLSGRGPVWLYGMLIHEAHASQAVATADPRLGYVVVQSHVVGFSAGQIVCIETSEGSDVNI